MRNKLIATICGLTLLVLAGVAFARPAAQFHLDPFSRAAGAGTLPALPRSDAPDAAGQTASTTDGAIWVTGRKTLTYFIGNGHAAAQVDFNQLQVGNPLLLAVDPYDDSAWVATTLDVLVNFDVDGQLRHIAALPGTPTALAIALDQTVWIAIEGTVFHLDREGYAEEGYRPATIDGPISGLAVDSLRDRVWIVTENGADVLHPGGAGEEGLRFDQQIRAAALDPRSGHLWILSDTGISMYDHRAQLVAAVDIVSIEASSEATRFDAIAYDARRDAMILASPQHWRLLDRDGQLLRPGADAGSDAADAGVIAPFRLLPELSWERTPTVDSGGATRLALTLRFDASCNDLRCDIVADYLSTWTLFATLNGNPVEGTLDYDAAAHRAIYTISSPAMIAEGSSISIHAVDRFGHVSNAVEAPLAAANSGHEVAPLKANQVPIVSMTAPANNATFVPGSNITLTATASDTDGTVVRVEFFRSGTLIGTALAPPYSIVWSNVAAGSFALTAKATDDKNATKTSTTVNIIVKAPPNVPPSVVIVSPVQGTTVNGPAVVIAASASDSDGTIAKVDFFDGATFLGTVAGGARSVAPTWTLADAASGGHALKVTATDNSGATTSASVTVTVNEAPYAVLTSPAACSEAIAPTDVTLAADGLDLDGTVARVDFFHESVLIGSADRAPFRLLWVKPSVGTYSLTAVAIDNLGARRSSNAVTFSVQPPDIPPVVTLTSPVRASKFGTGSAVTLLASASDIDGSIIRVDFYAGGAQIGTSAAAPYTATWKPASAGLYSLAAKAVDNRGVSTTSAAVDVTVVNNLVPTVTLAMPAGGPVFVAPVTLTLVATASDADGIVKRVDFLAGPQGSVPSTLIGSATVPPFSVPFSITQPGDSYSVMARATDDLGGTGTSAILRLQASAGVKVSIVSPAENTVVLPGPGVVVTARASAADGYVTLVIAEGYVDGTLVFQDPAPRLDYSTGQYSFRPHLLPPDSTVTLLATAFHSSGGVSHSPPVHVKTMPLPIVTLLTPKRYEEFAEPATITLTASASQPAGKIVKVNYYQQGSLIGSSTTPPYAVTWSNIVNRDGYPYKTVYAEAIDNLGVGGVGRSAGTTIVVDHLQLTIVSPASVNAQVYAPEYEVRGTYSGSIAPTGITVNGLPATFANGTFSARISLQPGGNGVTVVAASSGGNVTRTSGVTYLVPSVTITSPTGQEIYYAPTMFRISAEVKNFQLAVKRVDFLVNGIKIASAASAPYLAYWNVVTGGTFMIEAQAVDASDHALASPRFGIFVDYPVGITIQSPTDNSAFSEGDSFRITGRARTASGDLVKIEVLRNDEVAGVIQIGNQPNIGFEITVPPSPAGDYVYVLRATDTTGQIRRSDPLHIHIASGPLIEMVLPKPDARLKSPAQIMLAARASTRIGTISQVDFFADDVLVASTTKEPFVATWPNVGNGKHDLKATATDSSGKRATTPVISVIVDNTALNVDMPDDSQVVYDSAIVVGGTVSGMAPNLSVSINGIVATTGNGTYAATVPLSMGQNAITITANIAGIITNRALTVIRADPSITFTNLSSGSVVHDDTILLRGRVSAPRNSALLIGGQVADIGPDGDFHVNSLPVSSGSNAIQAKLVKQDGSEITWSLTGITRDAVQPFELGLSGAVGLDLPFDATLTLTRRAETDFSRVVIMDSGVTTLDETVTSEKDQRIYQMTFNDFGVHLVTVKVFDAGGTEVYARSMIARVLRPNDIERQIRSSFVGTLYTMLAGNIASALQSFDASTRTFYQAVFSGLGSNLVKIIDLMREVSLVTFGHSYGEVLLTRNRPDGVYAYPVQISRDEKGIWRLSGL